MKTILFLLIFGSIGFGFSGAAWAQTPTKREIATAYRIVRNASYFAIGGVGIAGTISNGERALQVLIVENDRKHLEALFLTKNFASKLYGLAAMRYLHLPSYRKYADKLGKSKEKVRVMSGCIGFTRPVQEVVSEIESKNFPEYIDADMARVRREKVYGAGFGEYNPPISEEEL